MEIIFNNSLPLLHKQLYNVTLRVWVKYRFDRIIKVVAVVGTNPRVLTVNSILDAQDTEGGIIDLLAAEDVLSKSRPEHISIVEIEAHETSD